MGEATLTPWMAWDGGWNEYATLEEARQKAEASLQRDREESYAYGWPDDADLNSIAVVLYAAKEHQGQCTGCEAQPGDEHDEECTPQDGDQPWHTEYTLEPVPGAIEAVLGLASDEQLRAEVERREGLVKGTLIDVLSSTAADLGRKVEALEAEVRRLQGVGVVHG